MNFLIKFSELIKLINRADILFIIRAKFLLFKGYIYIIINRFYYSSKFFIDSPFQIWGKIIITIYGDGHIKIGKNFRAVSDNHRSFIALYSPCKMTTIGSGQIIIGNNVGINGTVMTSRLKISIGDNTMIAPNVIIMDHDAHNPWPIKDRWLYQDNPEEIIIGENVWIGMNCIILKGAKISNGSVIASGSIVNSFVPQNSLAAGNPARFIKNYHD